MALKLHLGCGKRDFGPDWYHVDGGHFRHVRHHDIINLPFGPETVDVIYASHVFEYFDQVQGKDVLEKWHSYLKPGGTLRLAVPDFEVLAKCYAEGRIVLGQVLGPLFGRMPMGDITIYHRTTYDFATLSASLAEAGFRNIRRYDWRKTDHAMYDDHSQAYIPHMDKENGILISLNVECDR
jgi:predicted SAM-dependent methyltransferase